MLKFLASRFLYACVTLFAITIIVFVVIQLPPGDYVTRLVTVLEAQGGIMSPEDIQGLRIQYNMDGSQVEIFFHWFFGLLRGDLGNSYAYQKPVTELLATRVPFTVLISTAALFFTYLVGVPIGIYSAIKKYSIGDYIFTVLGFIGLAIPSFVLALFIMFFFFKLTGASIGGLVSPQYLDQPWHMEKILNMLQHLPPAIIIVGLAGAAELIRVMRGSLLDELEKLYVVNERSKGLSEVRAITKYPLRIAMNPIISTIGWMLPVVVGGEVLTSIVLNIPTTGPMLLEALKSEDMYLAGGIVMILSLLVVVGTFISDILLVVIDPRIRIS